VSGNTRVRLLTEREAGDCGPRAAYEIVDDEGAMVWLTLGDAESLRDSLVANLGPAKVSRAPAGGATVRVRVAVAVHPDGAWSAMGDSDPAAQEELSRNVDFAWGWSLVWVEADVPLPTNLTVEGRAVEQEAQ
jgi:hypothetical protein